VAHPARASVPVRMTMSRHIPPLPEMPWSHAGHGAVLFGRARRSMSPNSSQGARSGNLIRPSVGAACRQSGVEAAVRHRQPAQALARHHRHRLYLAQRPPGPQASAPRLAPRSSNPTPRPVATPSITLHICATGSGRSMGWVRGRLVGVNARTVVTAHTPLACFPVRLLRCSGPRHG
jgi:hypothetical protein